MRDENCSARANSVSRPAGTMWVWIRPVRGLASISAASRTMVSPSIRLSASSTIMMRVVGPARLDPFGDVAGLLAGVACAPAIEQARLAAAAARAARPKQRSPRAAISALRRVAQHEEVEGVRLPGRLAASASIAASRPRDVGRDPRCRPASGSPCARAAAGSRHRPAIVARRVTGWQPQHAQQEAEHAAPEGQRDPGEQQRKAGQEDRLQ